MTSQKEPNLFEKLNELQKTLNDPNEIQFVEYYKTIVKYYEEDPDILDKLKGILGNMK